MNTAVVARKLRNAWRLLRKNRRALIRNYFIRIDRFHVFAQVPALVPPPREDANLSCEPLSDEQMQNLPPGFEEQTDRFNRYGFHAASGVYLNGELGHINWLITADQDWKRRDRVVTLRRGEAEIAHGFTLPQFRRRGMQVYAIQRLAALARERSIKRLYAITVAGNAISERGISSAGLPFHSRAYRIVIAPLYLNWSFVLRGHRKPWSLLLGKPRVSFP